MPNATDNSAPTTFPKPDYLTLDNFKRGVITLIDKSKLPKNALERLDNGWLVEDGQPSVRPGTGWYGSVMPNAGVIDGFDYFDAAGVIHLVATAGGVVYRSINDGLTWTACTGATLTAGVTTNMNQSASFLYITNGIDQIIRYDGTTTLQVYTTLATPVAPTATVTGLATSSAYKFFYKVSAVNQIGFSIASPKVTATVDRTRDGWDQTSNYVTLAITAVAGATRYDIYLSDDDLNYFYLDSTTGTAYKDDGTAVVVPSTTAPTGDTTTGPRVAELVSVGSRQYGIRDTDNRYRIWFTGSGTYAGAFSSAYDGGYLDWQKGGKYIPKQVVDYRDGKGTPYATIFCDSADGQGCILQMSLDTLTVQDISITVPSAYKLPGSRGTPASGSVVNVLNDYMFYNSQAFYNLGSRAQYLNLLSTDESSANIRPTVKGISANGENNIASAYFDARVYFSVPLGSTTNNTTSIYDTERKAWLPTAFTIGFKKFLRYTSTASDGTKTKRLLAVKPGDNQLSEISSNIHGDYGVPFRTFLSTGLYQVSANRFEFQFTEEAEYEFSDPQEDIIIDVLGIDRNKGYTVQKSKIMQNNTTTVSGAGWDSFAWDKKPWDDTSVVPVVYSESSSKRYFPMQKELNSIQWNITSQSLNSAWILRTLQTWGTDTEGGKPRQWRTN